MKNLPTRLKLYLVLIYVATFSALALFIIKNNINIVTSLSDYKPILFFSALMTLTESFTVEFRGISFSTGFAVIIAAFIIKGPIFAIIIVVIGYSFKIEKDKDKFFHLINTPLYKTLFNYCDYILTIIFGNYIFVLLHGVNNTINIVNYLIPIIAFCFANFFMNILIISILFSIINGKSLVYNFLGNLKLGALNFLAMAPMGITAAYIFYPSNYGGLTLFIFPIILARFTFSQYIEAKTKYIQTVDVIMHAMEARDKYTEGHSKRVAELSCLIASELKYNEWKMEDLNIAALLHDVGKIGIDDHILNKPGRLTDDEYDTIKQHPEIGYKIIKDIKDTDDITSIVKHHHERYDGKGYPEGKSVDELSLDVFIIQLADSIDAMATDRPYRKALSQEIIIEEIKKCRGTQFHPVVVDAYLRAVQKQGQNGEVS